MKSDKYLREFTKTFHVFTRRYLILQAAELFVGIASAGAIFYTSAFTISNVANKQCKNDNDE